MARPPIAAIDTLCRHHLMALIDWIDEELDQRSHRHKKLMELKKSIIDNTDPTVQRHTADLNIALSHKNTTYERNRA